MNHHHIDRRRVARSAECRMVGETATPPAEIHALVRKARQAGVVVFLKPDLEQLPAFERVVIEGVHKRICGKGR